MKTHWKISRNPDYIGAYCIPENSEIMVKIVKVGIEDVRTQKGIEKLQVAKLENNKPLILNVTNCKSIHKLYGPYVEDWIGKTIVLYASKTKLANEMVECVRIRPYSVIKDAPSQENNKEPITDSRLAKAVENIVLGKYTKEKLLQKFLLTAEQLEFLENSLTTQENGEEDDEQTTEQYKDTSIESIKDNGE